MAKRSPNKSVEGVSGAPSFVPRSSDTEAAQLHVERVRRSLNIFVTIATVIFLAAVAGAALSYLYVAHNETRLQAAQSEVVDAAAALDDEIVPRLSQFDVRLRATQELLDNHVAFSQALREVGDFTLPAIQFTSFSGQVNESGNMDVSGVGVATSFEMLALQSDKFAESSSIVNPVFADFERNDNGLIDFNYSFTINRDVFIFDPELGTDVVSSDDSTSATTDSSSESETGSIENDETTTETVTDAGTVIITENEPFNPDNQGGGQTDDQVNPATQ